MHKWFLVFLLETATSVYLFKNHLGFFQFSAIYGTSLSHWYLPILFLYL